jgi:hypothetical protein
MLAGGVDPGVKLMDRMGGTGTCAGELADPSMTKPSHIVTMARAQRMNKAMKPRLAGAQILRATRHAASVPDVECFITHPALSVDVLQRFRAGQSPR